MISLIQPLWLSTWNRAIVSNRGTSRKRDQPTSSQLRAISFTPRFAKSLLSICTLETILASSSKATKFYSYTMSVPAKLSGAHWSVVSRMGEEDGPAVLKIYPALCNVIHFNGSFTWIQLWKSMFPCVVSDREDKITTSIYLKWTQNFLPEEKFGTTSPSLSTWPGMVAAL